MAERDESPVKGFLDADPQAPASWGRHRESLNGQLGSAWPLGGKLGYVAIGAGGLVGFLVCGSLCLTEPASTPTAVRGLLGLFALFGLGWTMFAARGLARRRGDFAGERLLASRIAFGFTLVALLGLGLAATSLGKEAQATPMLVAGLAFLILAGVGLTSARIEESELAVREQILRLEHRLIESVGTTRAGRPGPSDS